MIDCAVQAHLCCKGAVWHSCFPNVCAELSIPRGCGGATQLHRPTGGPSGLLLDKPTSRRAVIAPAAAPSQQLESKIYKMHYGHQRRMQRRHAQARLAARMLSCAAGRGHTRWAAAHRTHSLSLKQTSPARSSHHTVTGRQASNAPLLTLITMPCRAVPCVPQRVHKPALHCSKRPSQRACHA